MSKFRVWFRCGCPSYGLAATKNLPAPGTPSGMTRTYQSPGVMPSIFSLAGMDCSTRIGLCGECGLLGELCLPEFVSANDVRARRQRGVEDDLVGGDIVHAERITQRQLVLGQGAGLVRAQHVHARPLFEGD